MGDIVSTIEGLLIHADVRLDADQIDRARESIMRRMIFSEDGTLVTPLAHLIEGERNANPMYFETRK